jgi:hypothetical protein
MMGRFITPGVHGCVLLAALSGCGDGKAASGTTLANGVFTYVCVADEVSCSFDDPFPVAHDGPMLSEIVAGGAFGFTYAPDDPSLEVSFEVVPSPRASLTQDASGLVTVTSHGPGFVSVLGQTPNGVVDLHTFELSSPTSLGIAGFDAQGSELFTGDFVAGATLTIDFDTIPASLEVTPTVSDVGLELPGALEWTWTTSDEQVVRYTGPTNGPRVAIEANAGNATLTVSGGQLMTTLEVTIP